MKTWSKWRIFKTVWVALGIILFIWNWSTFQSWNLPKGILKNSALVSVLVSRDQISFTPVTSANKLQVIFFQGGLTDPKAYSPLCRHLAENGFTCHLIKMNWRLPQNDYQKTSELFNLKNGNYVIGGHSQGGRMAAQFVYENPGLMKGLFLLGTSHPRDIDLSGQSIPCIKLYAENDGLASVEEVMENKTKLPSHTKWVLITGGNHSQFGYLGKLMMDNKADITLEQQQQQTMDNLVVFLKGIWEQIANDSTKHLQK